MRKVIFLFTILLLFPALKSRCQDKSFQRILIVCPEKIEFEKSLKRKERKINNEILKGMLGGRNNFYKPLLSIEGIPPEKKMHAEYMIAFLENWSLQTFATYELSANLQNLSSNLNQKQAYLPVLTSTSYSIDSLRNLAFLESADLIIFSDTVHYFFEQDNVTIYPSLNLYDLKSDSILFSHLKAPVKENVSFSLNTTSSYGKFDIIVSCKRDYEGIMKRLFDVEVTLSVDFLP